MPRAVLPDVACIHGLRTATSPGHIKQCHGATPADTILLQDYFAMRAGLCTSDDSVLINRRLANTHHCEDASFYRPKSGGSSLFARTPSNYSGTTLYGPEDDEDDNVDGEGGFPFAKLIDGLQPCGSNARDSFDIVRGQLKDKKKQRRARMGPVRRLWHKLLD